MVEELLLVAVLVCALEAARQPTWAIYAVAVTVRVSFHLYYGQPWWGMLSLLPLILWAAAAVALFRWARMIVPLIVVHAGWDVLGTTAHHVGTAWADVVVLMCLFLLGGACGIYLGICSRRQRRAARAELAPVVAAAATALAVPVPRVALAGEAPPEVYRDLRGRPVLRYSWKQARRHTAEQRAGLVAHALAHLALGHPLSRRRYQRLVIGAPVVLGLVVGSAYLGWWFGAPTSWLIIPAMLAATTGVAWFGATRIARRRAVMGATARHTREIAADAAAAAAVGVDAIRAAIATPDGSPSKGAPATQHLPAPDVRLRALTESRVWTPTASPASSSQASRR